MDDDFPIESLEGYLSKIDSATGKVRRAVQEGIYDGREIATDANLVVEGAVRNIRVLISEYKNKR